MQQLMYNKLGNVQSNTSSVFTLLLSLYSFFLL